MKNQIKHYIFLRQKGFADEIIEKINKEIEKRLESILNKIIHKLENMHFDNPEESLEGFLLKQVIQILDDMQIEKLLDISEEDKKIIFDILNNKDDKNKEKNQQKVGFKKIIFHSYVNYC